MADRQLKVTIVGDTRSLDRALGRTETRLSRFGRKVGVKPGVRGGGVFGAIGKGGVIGAGVAVGATLAAKQLNVLTEAGSDLNEQITKSQAVFGDSARSVSDWSKSTARSFGISRTAALEASGTFGNLFGAVGIDTGRSSQMSRRLVALAADLASFNNADPSDVLASLRSGLIGEAEPLRKFGVLLSETRVQQLALKQTGKDNVRSLTDQEKATARYSIILKDTKRAQGDFGRTSNGLANQQRILRARFADIQADLGTKLLPVMIKLTAVAIRTIDYAEKNWPRYSKAVVDAYAKIKPIIDNQVAKFRAFANAVAGVVHIIHGIFTGDWAEAWKGFKQYAVDGVLGVVKAVVSLPLLVAKSLGKAAFSGIEKAFEVALNRIIGLINKAIGAYNKIPLLPNVGKVPTLGDTKKASGVLSNATVPSPQAAPRSSDAHRDAGSVRSPQTVNLVVDGRVLASVVTQHQQKRGSQTASQSRGRNSGHHVVVG